MTVYRSRYSIQHILQRSNVYNGAFESDSITHDDHTSIITSNMLMFILIINITLLYLV